MFLSYSWIKSQYTHVDFISSQLFITKFHSFGIRCITRPITSATNWRTIQDRSCFTNLAECAVSECKRGEDLRCLPTHSWDYAPRGVRSITTLTAFVTITCGPSAKEESCPFTIGTLFSHTCPCRAEAYQTLCGPVGPRPAQLWKRQKFVRQSDCEGHVRV